MGDTADPLVAAVTECRAHKSTLGIVGHGSKAALGAVGGERCLATVDHAGIVAYRPEELVVTARAGTPLAELDAALAERGQMLPFDPPRFGGAGTLGGAIASGLSGPARPWRGSARDAVLGVEIVNGLGERLRFGGSVMKNVAGYDVSRLTTGARGRLGVVLSASVRVAPRPPEEETWRTSCDAQQAAEMYRLWARQPLPISATCWVDGELNVRLSGSASGIAKARRTMGLDAPGDNGLWAVLRDHGHAFFAAAPTVTRLSLPRGSLHARVPLALPAEGSNFEDATALVEWGGCQVWLHGVSAAPTGALATVFYRQGAIATRSGQSDANDAATKYERRLLRAFDPDGIFNPGLNDVPST